MSSDGRFRMQLLEETPDAPSLGEPTRGPSPATPTPTLDPPTLQAAQAALMKNAEMQRRTVSQIQILLQILNVRFLLLLGLLAATALTWLVLSNQAASIAQMTLVAAVDALLLLPLVALYARKGGL